MSRLPPNALYAGLLILVSLGLLALSLGGFLQPAESALLQPLGAIQGWLSVRLDGLQDLLTTPTDVVALRARVQELESENAQLQQEIIALREEAEVAELLSALVQYARGQTDRSYLAAKVISRDVSPFLRSVWIQAGSDDGLGYGMPVVTNRGLVGRVVEVFATVSRIQLITDPQLAVSLRLQDSRADGVLEAQLNGELWMTMIDQDAAVSEGEIALTSGLGGSFPVNIPVGQVTSVRRRDFEIFQQAVVQPSVEFDDLELVLVITNFRTLPFEAPGP
ncbi:MAG TPA: rod shape-determining protein MreC [Anaerolineales bacterium]|jgi:rod shape-determining protein MreC